MSINKNGYWEGTEANEQHLHDPELANYLVDFFKNETKKKLNLNLNLVDFGCGMGNYVKTFQENGIGAAGFDGNPNTPDLTNGMCKILDLSKEILFDKQFDWVMSLEVGEHLPKEFEEIFINNLHNNNKYGIILSWAIEGQGGHGHINEQNCDYIKSKFNKLGYFNDTIIESEMRTHASLWWFKNTIMVFRKNI